MFPHERSLVKRLEGKPFALLGINTDSNLEQLKQKNEAQQITWRSWWDKGTGGPIDTAWNVHSWPTIYVLDHKGVIRYQDVREEAMDQAVDKLLAELEAEQKR
jgi:hypothetical protein